MSASDDFTMNSGFYNAGSSIVGCGVYLFNCNPTGGDLGGRPMPVPCTIDYLGRTGSQNDLFDIVVVFPGYKVLIDETTLYDPNSASFAKKTLDNTNGTKIVCRKIDPPNSTSAIRV